MSVNYRSSSSFDEQFVPEDKSMGVLHYWRESTLRGSVDSEMIPIWYKPGLMSYQLECVRPSTIKQAEIKSKQLIVKSLQNLNINNRSSSLETTDQSIRGQSGKSTTTQDYSETLSSSSASFQNKPSLEKQQSASSEEQSERMNKRPVIKDDDRVLSITASSKGSSLMMDIVDHPDELEDPEVPFRRNQFREKRLSKVISNDYQTSLFTRKVYLTTELRDKDRPVEDTRMTLDLSVDPKGRMAVAAETDRDGKISSDGPQLIINGVSINPDKADVFRSLGVDIEEKLGPREMLRKIYNGPPIETKVKAPDEPTITINKAEGPTEGEETGQKCTPEALNRSNHAADASTMTSPSVTSETSSNPSKGVTAYLETSDKITQSDDVTEATSITEMISHSTSPRRPSGDAMASLEETIKIKNLVRRIERIASCKKHTKHLSKEKLMHFAKTGHAANLIQRHMLVRDTSVQCGRHPYEFEAHAAVLAAHSPYIARQLLSLNNVSPPFHVALPDSVSLSSFAAILEYMYRGDVDMNRVDVSELIESSSLLGMTLLVDKCNQFINEEPLKRQGSPNCSPSRSDVRDTRAKSTPARSDEEGMSRRLYNKSNSAKQRSFSLPDPDRSSATDRIERASPIEIIERSKRKMKKQESDGRSRRRTERLLNQDDSVSILQPGCSFSGKRVYHMSPERDASRSVNYRITHHEEVAFPIKSIRSLVAESGIPDVLEDTNKGNLSNASSTTVIPVSPHPESPGQESSPRVVPIRSPHKLRKKITLYKSDASSPRAGGKLMTLRLTSPGDTASISTNSPKARSPILQLSPKKIGIYKSVSSLGEATISTEKLSGVVRLDSVKKRQQRLLELVQGQPSTPPSPDARQKKRLERKKELERKRQIAERHKNIRLEANRLVTPAVQATTSRRGYNDAEDLTFGGELPSGGDVTVVPMQDGQSHTYRISGEESESSEAATQSSSRHTMEERTRDEILKLEAEEIREPALLLIGGITSPERAQSEMLTYIPYKRKWNSIGNLPRTITHHVAVILHDDVYVIGGSTVDDSVDGDGKFSPSNATYRFSPDVGVWRRVADMETPRMYHCACVIESHIYVAGGLDKHKNTLSSVECYSAASNTWTPMASMTTPRIGAASAAHRGRMVIAGGSNEKQQEYKDYVLLSSVETFNPITNRWRSLRPLRFSRCFATLTEVNDALYLAGGLALSLVFRHSTVSTCSIDKYDPDMDRWNPVIELQLPRHHHAACEYEDKLVILGGQSTINFAATSTVECYNVIMNSLCDDVCRLPTASSGGECVYVR